MTASEDSLFIANLSSSLITFTLSSSSSSSTVLILARQFEPDSPVMRPFQRHMLFFAKSDGTSQITLLSSIRASLSLGLDFPVACILSLGLKFLYSPFPYISPIHVPSLPPNQHRTQLENVTLQPGKSTYSRSDILALYKNQTPKAPGLLHRAYDYMHVYSFWMIAADCKTHLVDIDTLRAFQEGNWEEGVVKRRKSRKEGKGEVLPLYRGGPISVVGHSWFVRKLFGVRVYEP